ncbi:hypothetical protein ACIP6T_24675 [Pantoea sp. NPDC088449]|uniref:hypothetical protein n=1 Tax=Pantoea sp. NPDC088449 TaxID=3364392 RepID=UPI003802097E
MLSRIEVNDFTIQMDKYKYGDFYDFDSLSLVVGKNGSGKTRALSEIINHLISYKKESAYYYNCRFYDEEGLELNHYGMSKIGMVYFTSLPFKPTFESGNENFIDASGKITGYSANFDIHKYEEILTYFKINPKVTASCVVNYTNVSRIIIEVMMKYVDSKDGYHTDYFNFSTIKSLREEAEELESRRNRLKKEDKDYDISSFEIKKFQGEIETILDRVCSQFIKDLLDENEEERVFVVFAVLDKLSKTNDFDFRVAQLVTQHLRLPISLPFFMNENRSARIFKDVNTLFSFVRKNRRHLEFKLKRGRLNSKILSCM